MSDERGDGSCFACEIVEGRYLHFTVARGMPAGDPAIFLVSRLTYGQKLYKVTTLIKPTPALDRKNP
jgi:hypothetical protein